MTALFVLGVVLAVIFSFSAAGYFVFFKTRISSGALKTGMTMLFGLVVFGLTLAVSIILVWPPYLWSILE